MADNEIALRRDETDSWIDIVGPVAKLADYIARTDFVPRAMRGNSPAVAATILTGRELALGPMTALRSLDVIEGNVQMKTKAILARIFQAGHTVEWIEATDQACEVRITRGDGLTSATARWTQADAKRAELTGKAVWRRYPRAMLRNRALSECAELACPDVILGLEVGDVDPSGSAQSGPVSVVQVTPEPATARPAPAGWPTAPAAAPVAEPEPPADAPASETTGDEPPAEDLISPAQMRKIGAQVREIEQIEGRKLPTDERRRLIAWMAGIAEPDSLASAKDLTCDQASRAIESLTERIAAMQDPPPAVDDDGAITDAEIVEDAQ